MCQKSTFVTSNETFVKKQNQYFYLMVTQFNNQIPINKIISQIMTGKAPLKKNKHNKRSLTCLVPKRHYFARPKRFGSRGPSENVRPFPTRLLRIRHRSELTERDCENAVQELGKSLTTNLWCDSQITLKPNSSFYKTGSRVSKIFKGCM